MFEDKSNGNTLFIFVFQRDLDFNIDIDFRGELTEMVESNSYKMR